MDGQTKRNEMTNRQMDRQTNRKTDGRIYEEMVIQTDGWTDRVYQ